LDLTAVKQLSHRRSTKSEQEAAHMLRAVELESSLRRQPLSRGAGSGRSGNAAALAHVAPAVARGRRANAVAAAQLRAD
jgi:hypothetical protein